ncbi:MAG: hypothetical protein U9N61_02870 [Euryarchaeota archaeon]|nr:hypothetical protein [Euryarchaeota archaeon]
MKLKQAFAEHLRELARMKGKSRLGYNIRNAVRALWTGVWGLNEFYDQIIISLEKAVNEAFEEAFAEYGISMDELTPTEKSVMFQFMNEQYNHIEGFAQSIQENSKANGGLLGPHLTRAQMWENRYLEAKNRAMQLAAADKHLRWTLGNADHCSSCLKLAGKVKRGSVWLARDIRPQHPNLECGGFRCACTLVPTDQPASRGPLPSIP